MAFRICNLVPHHQVAALDNTKGDLGRGNVIAIDDAGSLWLKRASGWVQITQGGASPAEVSVPVAGSVTIKNSAGTTLRTLTAAAGVVTLAATDTIVGNGDSIVLKKSDGTTTSSGNATLNSPATAVVAAGVLSNVRASA